MSSELMPAPQMQTQPQDRYLSADAERFAMQQRMAKLMVISGLFNDIKGATQEQAIAQAYIKISLGEALGFSAPESMTGIDIVQGKVAISAQLRAARMQRAGYNWTIDQLDDKGCSITVYLKAQRLGEVSFMEADAKAARLWDKDNWKAHRTDMFWARTISRAQRRFAPGVLSLDIPNIEEAFDAPPPSPPEIPAQTATNAKTAALAAKLESKREQANGKEAEKPAPAPQPAAEPQAGSTGDLF